MAARNPLLDAMTGGGSENPLLNAMAASEAVTGLTGPRATPAPSLADTITNPNSLEGIRQSRAAEASRLPNERGMGEVRRPPANAANVLRGLGITTVEAWRQAGSGIKMQAQDLLGPAIDGWIERNMPSAMTQDERRAAFGGTEAEKDFARSQARSDAATPEFQSDFWEAVYGGLQSTAQTAPGIAAGILAGPAAGLGILGAQTEAQSYGKYRGRGATPGMAGLGAVGEGAVEVGTELLPMGFLVGKLGKAGAGEFLTGLLARELPTEQIATFAQDAIDTAVANPDKTWEQFWAERPDAAYKTAIATVVQSGIYGGVNAIAARKPEPMAISTPGEIDQAARDAFRPDQDGKTDIPLTAGDRASPIPDAVIQKGKNALADALGADRAPKPATPAAAARQVAPAADQFSRMVQITLGSESGNRDLDANGNILTSPAGAKGRMQVLDGTNLDPGFGVRPAQDNSLAERARVGRDYLAAMLKRYGGDPARAWSAYNAGPGRVDDAIREYGENWLAHMPDETRKYVFKNLSQLGRGGFTESGEVRTINPPEQVDDEDPIAFAARILGEDFLSSNATTEGISSQDETVARNDGQPGISDMARDQNPVPQPEPQIVPSLRGGGDNNLPGMAGELSVFPGSSGSEAVPDAFGGQDRQRQGLPAGQRPMGNASSAGAEQFQRSPVDVSGQDYDRIRMGAGNGRGVYDNNRADEPGVFAGGRSVSAQDTGQGRAEAGTQRPVDDRAGVGAAYRDNEANAQETLAGGNPAGASLAEPDATSIANRQRADRRNDTEADLLTFLAANGGISDEEGGHSLRAQRNLQRFIPGLGSLIRPSGMSIDYARERMIETGWLPEGASEADALEMIEDASFRPVYHPASERGERAAVGADQEEARQQNARELVQQEAERLGIETLTPADIDFAASLSLNEGYSERDALWAALEQAMAADFAAYPDTVKEQYNVPFDAAGAEGWSQVQEPFAEPEAGSADQEGGERSAPVERAASEGESAPVGPGEAEGGVTLEDTPSGKGVVVRGASEAQLEAIKAALPEKASGMVGRDNGVTFSKKHEDAIRSALRASKERDTETERQAGNEGTSPSGPQAGSRSQPAATQSQPEGRTADAAQASPPASAPSGNRIFTDDMAQRARERLKQKLSGSTLNSGVDPELLLDGVVLAGWHVEKGARKFADFARAMVEDLGDQVRPYLKSWYLGLKYDPRARSISGLDTVSTVDAFDIDASFDQPIADSVPVVARLLDDGTQREALLIQGFEALDVNIQRSVLAQMVSRLHDDEVVRAVVKAVPVDVMNVLIGQEGAPQLILNDPSVLRRALTIPFNLPIPSSVSDFVNAIVAMGQPEASPSAVGGGANADQGMVTVEGDAALGASQSNVGQNEYSGTNGISENIPNVPTAQQAQDAFVNAFLAGRAFASITEARAFAQEQTGQSYAPGTEAAKQLDEAIESAVVYAARAIAIENEGDPQRTYGRLVQLYGQQPRLGVRTSTSIEQQAYSTPVPLAYLASRLAGINQNTTVYEPSAGNGALLIDTRPTYVTANELNPDRVAQLREFLRGAKISQNDAAEWRPAGQFDVVTANPPFGSVKDDAGNTIRFQVDNQYSTNEIDHAIAMKALEAMKDNGRAVLIVGGINKQITDPRARADAYNGKAKREFYFKLYSQYNVVDHFTVDGALYAKQGAGWPVDVIVIDGRGKSSLRLPAVSAPRQYNSWDALQEVLTNGRNANPATASAVRGSNGSAATQGARPVATDVGNLGSERSSRDNGRAGRDQAQQPEPVRAGSSDGQSGGIRVDAERAPVDQAPGAVFSEPALGRDPVTPTEAQQPIPEVAENERQVAYQAGSRSGAMGTLVPVNMQTAISDALDALAQRRGNIDTYVSRSLGYTQAEMNANFGAEQVDAIALAIDNIERGAGFIIGDQCVAGETPIFDPVAKTYTPIRELAEAGNSITVLSLTRNGFEPRPASAPFRKGKADLHRVTLDDGSSILVTAGHRFLSIEGWTSIRAGLRPGNLLISMEASDLSLGSVELTLPPYAPADDRHSTHEAQGFRYHCSSDHHPCGEQPPCVSESGATCAPSSSDAHARIHCYSHGDGQEPSPEYSHLRRPFGRHSKNNSSPSESLGLSPISNQARAWSASLSGLTRQGLMPSDPYSASLHPEGGEEQLGLLTVTGRKFSSSSVDDTGLRRVVSIAFERHDDFYDMHVPGSYNYVANGLVNHNTGIGKGRVNAAVIRYAIRQGLNPVFVTEKPNLYADMFRDMEDIGLPKMLGRPINAVMTNSGVTVPLGEGRDPLRSPADAKKHDQALRDISLKGLKAAGVDVLMTTYSQMQTVRGKATERQEVIRRLANGGLVILDESHNAGGTQNAFKEAGAPPNRAEFVRELVQASKGTFYSSATYAKRPDVMDLYSATDMKLAVDDLEKLGEAISKGGVPMQQVVAAMLARAGQYVRRERSFDGISYNTPTIEVDRGQYNNVSTVLAAIQDFSENIVGPAVEMIDMELRASGENIAPDGSTGSAGAASTNFTAIMHNVVDQMLLAFGANEAANRAIDAIRAGEKPVIALASTLETFIDEYAADAGAQPGDKLDITFADIFRRYLERTRRYTVKKPFAEKGDKPERKRLTDAQLGAEGVRAFNDALALIDQAELESLPGSPIDFIISRIEDAGFKVGEITGRSMGIDYRQDGTYLKKRGQDQRSIKGRLTAINGFNGGSIDAMILNKSGSTGLSLHASDRFKDQRKRRMIIVQADGNIDTHMQMLGRVHRTGQVVLPEYDQLVVGVPAARRPAAVLAKKMASLNANTTASRDSALTSADVLDFMNIYGDEIAARLMEDEPDIHMRLGQPLSETDKGGLNREEAARKVTGRIPLLPIDTQEDLYQRLEDEYRALIAQKDAAGENALEAKTFDFDAELVDRTEAQPPVVGSSSPFADGVYVERVRVKRIGKPIPGRDVIGMIADGLEVSAPAGAPAQALAQLQREGAAINKARADQTIADARAYIPEATASIKDEEKQKAERDKLSQTLREFEAIRRSIAPGDTIRIKTDNGNVYGVITDIYRSGRAKNPAALGVWRTRIAIVDAAREMTISFSQMKVPGGEAKEGRIELEKADSIGLFRIIDAFDEMQVDSREERSIVTGNLLAGFDYVNGKGAIINYTASGGQVRQGILLPREFNLEKHQAAKPIALSTPEMVDAFLRADKGGGNLIGNGKTGSVAVSAIPHRDTFIITAAKAKSSGGEFFLNPALRAVMGDFVSRSNGMVADSSMAKAIPAIRALMESGVRFEVPAGAADDTKAIARDIVDRMRPPAPEPVAQLQETSQTVATDNFADVEQPQRTMTQQQRGELEARQQQSMARRGGQEAISDQAGGLFSSERDQDSLFSIEASEQNQRDWGDVVPRLNEAFRKMGLVDKVTLDTVDLILNDPNIAGRYTPRTRILQVALSTAQNPEYTLDHEAIHALYDLGLFRAAEWTALKNAAARDAKLMESVRQRYGDLSEDFLVEEAISDMFAQWRAGRRSQSGFVRQALQRILDFLTAIRRAVTGARAEDEVRDILRRIESGEVGGRDPDGPGGGGADTASFSLIGNKKASPSEALDMFRRKAQDRMLPLQRTQARIELQYGIKLTEQQDVRGAEELLTNRTGARLNTLTEDMVEPLMLTMEARKISSAQLGEYLYARHAAERNARISSINAQFDEGEGSGMSDAEAAGILARIEAEGRTEDMEAAAEIVDRILKFARDTRVDAGLLSQEEADAWAETYEYYVPLRGFAEIEPENGSADAPARGRGMSVRGAESRRALGRSSKAADIVEYSIMQAEEAIIRAQKNEVATALYNLARAYPDPDFWTVNPVTRKPYWNEKTGTVAYRNATELSAKDERYTVSAKVDGKEVRIRFNETSPEAVRFADAMKLAGSSDLGPLKYLGKWNRLQSALNTRFMPPFVVTNAMRDIQSAAFNLNAQGRGDIAKGAGRDYFKAMRAAWRGSRGNSGNSVSAKEWDRWYKEFEQEGGKTAFNAMDDIEAIRSRIQKRLKVATTTTGQAFMSAKHVASDGIKLVESMNDSVENAVRLSVYKNARERGMSKREAARLAQNVTVNFTKRGEWSTVLNSLYLFYNASIQGSATTAKMLKYKRGRQIAASLVFLGLAVDLLNAMFSGDDDDGESFYDKIPDFEKSRNLIIMTGDDKGGYIKIPLAFGLNIFPGIGRTVGEIYRGREWKKAAGNMLGTIADAFNPIGGTTNIINFLAPTFADPFVDIDRNRNFADKPIYPDKNPFAPEGADSADHFPGTGPIWKTSAWALNAASGGDEVLPGLVDVHPETLKYVYGTLTGGAGRFAGDLIDLPSKLASGDPMTINDIPFANKIVGKKPEWMDKANFYARVNELEYIASRPKEYAEAGREDKADAYVFNNEKAFSLIGEMKAAKKSMKKIRAARRDVAGAEADGTMTAEEAREAMAEIKASEDEIINSFNRAYVATMKP